FPFFSPEFRNACTAPRSAWKLSPTRRSTVLPFSVNSNSPSSTKNVSSSCWCECGGGPPPGGTNSVNVTDFPPLVSPPTRISICSPKTLKLFSAAISPLTEKCVLNSGHILSRPHNHASAASQLIAKSPVRLYLSAEISRLSIQEAEFPRVLL